MRRNDLIYIITGLFFLIVSLFFYLPKKAEVREIETDIRKKSAEISRLSTQVPRWWQAGTEMAELTEEKKRLRTLLPPEWDVTGATEEIVRRSRQTESITIESINETGAAGPGPEGVKKWLIRVRLKASFPDFARFLDRLERSAIPLAVESFVISHPDDTAPRCLIELTVAIVKYPGDLFSK